MFYSIYGVISDQNALALIYIYDLWTIKVPLESRTTLI